MWSSGVSLALNRASVDKTIRSTQLLTSVGKVPWLRTRQAIWTGSPLCAVAGADTASTARSVNCRVTFVGCAEMPTLLPSFGYSTTLPAMSVCTTNQRLPLRLRSKVKVWLRSIEALTATVPVKGTSATNVSLPIAASLENESRSVQVPVTSAVPLFVTVQVTVIG